MNKDIVNYQIVVMRKDVKVAKMNLTKKLKKQISTLQSRIDSKPSEKQGLLESKVQKKTAEIQLVKSINSDVVSKTALQSLEKLDKLYKDPNISQEERVAAKLAKHPRILKAVLKFREENADWELYLPSVLELWKEKDNLKKKKKKKDKSDVDKKPASEENKSQKQLKPKRPNPVTEAVKRVSTMVVKQVKLNDIEEPIIPIIDQQNEQSVDSNKAEEPNESSTDADSRAEFVDDFFVNKKTLFAPKANESEENNYKPKAGKFKKDERHFKFQKTSDFEGQERNSFSAKEETLHPSWEARKKQKIPLRIDLSAPNSNKKIRFE